MKIHFYTKRDEKTGSSRQRAFLVADELNKKGVSADVHRPSGALISETPWPRKMKLIWHHVVGFTEIKKDDILYLQRPINNKYLVLLIIFYKLLFRRKMLFDMDDTVYVYLPYKTRFFTKMCDGIIVGSHYLYDWAKKYNSKVYIIPTSVTFEKYQAFTRDYSTRSEKLTIGWIGGANYHYDNLKLLVPVFQGLVEKSIPFKFILIGSSGNQKVYDLFNHIQGLDVEFIDALNWSDPKAAPSNIQKFDIGLMPLVDDETTRGKCAFKAIEYMACGVATIVSPVGENPYLVQDGINGFLARNTEEWIEKILRISQDTELASRLGKAGQSTIKDHYSFDANVTKLIEIFPQI